MPVGLSIFSKEDRALILLVSEVSVQGFLTGFLLIFHGEGGENILIFFSFLEHPGLNTQVLGAPTFILVVRQIWLGTDAES